LKCSNQKGECHLETKNLDGETNLKKRRAPKNLNSLSEKELSRQCLLNIHYEKPNE
jgi:hypothetical protein